MIVFWWWLGYVMAAAVVMISNEWLWLVIHIVTHIVDDKMMVTDADFWWKGLMHWIICAFPPFHVNVLKEIECHCSHCSHCIALWIHLPADPCSPYDFCHFISALFILLRFEDPYLIAGSSKASLFDHIQQSHQRLAEESLLATCPQGAASWWKSSLWSEMNKTLTEMMQSAQFRISWIALN